MDKHNRDHKKNRPEEAGRQNADFRMERDIFKKEIGTFSNKANSKKALKTDPT